MTYQEFVDRAVAEKLRALGLPAGWWGDWKHVFSPAGVRIRLVGTAWKLYGGDGKWVSSHGSRSYAINKARGLFAPPTGTKRT